MKNKRHEQFRRLARPVTLLSIVAILVGFGALSPVRVLAVTATPTPTNTPIAIPTALPPGFNSNSNFAVDNNAQLPWPLPWLPTFPVASATPTLYNATAQHGTDYPNQVGTATAGIAQLTGPVNSISTPVAGMIGAAPTPNGTDLDTGIDVGSGNITFIGVAEDLADDIGPAVATAVGFIQGVIGLLNYSPVLYPIVLAEVIVLIIEAFMFVVPLIIKSGAWIINFVIRLLTMFGALKPR